MSNQLDIRNAVLVVGMEAINLPYPTKWPNAPFPNQPSGATWIRITPLYGTPVQTGLAKTDRVDGVLQVDIFTPRDTGDAVAMGIADDLRQALPVNGQSLNSGGVKVKFSSAGLNGNGVDDGGWTKFIFEARFYAYIDRTA